MASKGLGDAAFFTVVGNVTAELAVRKGGRAFDLSVGVAAFSLVQIEAAETTLARAALARLSWIQDGVRSSVDGVGHARRWGVISDLS